MSAGRFTTKFAYTGFAFALALMLLPISNSFAGKEEDLEKDSEFKKLEKTNPAALPSSNGVIKEIHSESVLTKSQLGDKANKFDGEVDSRRIVGTCKEKGSEKNEYCLNAANKALALDTAGKIEVVKSVDKAKLQTLLNERETQLQAQIDQRKTLTDIMKRAALRDKEAMRGDPKDNALIISVGDGVSSTQYTYSHLAKYTEDAYRKEQEYLEYMRTRPASQEPVTQTSAQTIQAQEYANNAAKIKLLASGLLETAKIIDRLGDSQEAIVDKLRSQKAALTYANEIGIYSEIAGQRSTSLNLTIDAKKAEELGFPDVKEKAKDGQYRISETIDASMGAGTKTIAEYTEQLIGRGNTPGIISAQEEALTRANMQRDNILELSNLYNARAVVMEARGGNAQAASRALGSVTPENSGMMAGLAGLLALANNGGNNNKGGVTNTLVPGKEFGLPTTFGTVAGKNPADANGQNSKTEKDKNGKGDLNAKGAAGILADSSGASQVVMSKRNLAGAISSGPGVTKASGAVAAMLEKQEKLLQAEEKRLSARGPAPGFSQGDMSASRSGRSTGMSATEAGDDVNGLVQSLFSEMNKGAQNILGDTFGNSEADAKRDLAAANAAIGNAEIPLFARVKEKLAQSVRKGEITSGQNEKL